MFEVDLGKIKFNWRGAFDTGNQYTVDDVVEWQGSSYVCVEDNGTVGYVNPPPTFAGNTAWELMAQGGSPSGSPADKDIIVYDADNSQQVYQRPTGVIAIHQKHFKYLAQYSSGGVLSQGSWAGVTDVYSNATGWTSIIPYMDAEVQNGTQEELYPWCVFQPKYDDSKFKVEFDFRCNWSGAHTGFRVMRYCVEDQTTTRPFDDNQWAIDNGYAGVLGDWKAYGSTSNGASHEYDAWDVQINFVDETSLDPNKHYLYVLQAEGGASTYINYNISYYNQAYSLNPTSRTIITEFRNPS